MPSYRVTVRFGRPQQYEVEDIEAATLADALRQAAERMPAARDAHADLAEVRIQADPERRSYVEG